MMQRLLSYSEIETALTCWARWDLSYGGRLAGDALSARGVIPILSEGKAWGAAVATWHQKSDTLMARWYAHDALQRAIEADMKAQRDAGVIIAPDIPVAMLEKLGAMLDHYMDTAEPLPNLSRMEEEVYVPIPSRTGRRSSNRYKFLAYLDGYTVRANGEEWLVEFKLRDQITPLKLVQLSRQIRWYAYGLSRVHHLNPTGVYVDERLNGVPKPARIVNAKRKADGIDGRTVSHAKDQLTTPDLYLAACAEYGVDPVQETVDALTARVWQQRHPIVFRPSEIEEAGRELASGGILIAQLDDGTLTPIRNASKMHCNGCRFNEICPAPQDRALVDAMFIRKPPKRLRDPNERTRR